MEKSYSLVAWYESNCAAQVQKRARRWKCRYEDTKVFFLERTNAKTCFLMM